MKRKISEKTAQEEPKLSKREKKNEPWMMLLNRLQLRMQEGAKKHLPSDLYTLIAPYLINPCKKLRRSLSK